MKIKLIKFFRSCSWQKKWWRREVPGNRQKKWWRREVPGNRQKKWWRKEVPGNRHVECFTVLCLDLEKARKNLSDRFNAFFRCTFLQLQFCRSRYDTPLKNVFLHSRYSLNPGARRPGRLLKAKKSMFAVTRPSLLKSPDPKLFFLENLQRLQKTFLRTSSFFIYNNFYLSTKKSEIASSVAFNAIEMV